MRWEAATTRTRSASTRLSHSPIRFQLANVWLAQRDTPEWRTSMPEWDLILTLPEATHT
jgi:hypothetical protein